MSVLVLWIATATAVSPVQALDVCSLVSRSEIAAAIGDTGGDNIAPDRLKASLRKIAGMLVPKL